MLGRVIADASRDHQEIQIPYVPQLVPSYRASRHCSWRWTFHGGLALYSSSNWNLSVFDAERVIILEPLFLLFGLMLTTIYLEKMERGGLFDKLRDSLDDPVNWKHSAKIMAMSTIGSAAVMND